MLTLNDRQKARSLLCGVKLVPDARQEPQNCSVARNEFLFKLCSEGSTELLDLLDELKPVTWRQFQEAMVEEKREKTILGYGPFFPESPTNPDVVAESLNYCSMVAKHLGQEFCIITRDQDIYEIVLALKKKHPDKYEHVIIRMSGFHIAMNFLGAIGHLMKETGLEDIVVEAGVCQPGTAKKLLDGKDYYAMVHAHFAVEQALFGLLWEAFEASALDQDTEDFSSLSTCLAQVITSLNEGTRILSFLRRIDP